MSVSIIACPKCSAMLLPDTVQCPTCQHILNPERADSLPTDAAPLDTLTGLAEDPCPSCGELVRQGMVRCWNCGTFMKKEIAESYQKLRQAPSQVFFSKVGSEEAEEEMPIASDAEMDAMFGDDEEFVLTTEFELGADPLASPGPPASKGGSTGPPSPTAHAPAPKTPPRTVPPGMVDHSIATAGDVLLQVAMQEQHETRNKYGARKTRTGFRVYCPNGHCIDVKERHRGLTGRCPRCKSPFYVPEQDWADPNAPKSEAEHVAKNPYVKWMSDVHFHTVNPAKLKLTPGSLVNDFQPMDFGFSPEAILAVTLAKKGGGGLFGGGGGEKKKSAARDAMHKHLDGGHPVGTLSVEDFKMIHLDAIQGIRIVQPVQDVHDSLFAGVPVFGDGRIAVRLPQAEGEVDLKFISFTLSEFRTFAGLLTEMYGMAGFGSDAGLPLVDSFTQFRCVFSDETLGALNFAEYYKTDPTLELKVIGCRCESCKVAVSEESRKKQKIGGANGKGLAKAVCPKCKRKFGENRLYTLVNLPSFGARASAAEQQESDAGKMD